MNVEIISANNPLVIVGTIPASCDNTRANREHEAGLQLLFIGMDILGLPHFEIAYKKTGKPYFKNNDNVFFSISHSCKYVACVISRQEIGCDIERIKKVPHNLDRYLALVAASQEDKNEDSIKRTKNWTRYEAIAKCIGDGIPFDDESFDIREWDFESWMVKNNYILSVAKRIMV